MPIAFGSFDSILAQWEYYGVFDFLLPFLLVFAIVYAVLSGTKWLGDNRGVEIVIALVIGLLSLRWRFFLSDFLSNLFPRLGIGLAILLTIFILVGMFINHDETRYWGWGLATLAGAVAIIVLYQTFSDLGYFYSGFSADNAGLIILAIILIGIIIAIGASGGGERRESEKGKGAAIWLPAKGFNKST